MRVARLGSFFSIALFLAAGCSNPPGRESGTVACRNGVDDDGDGLIDCDDSSCAGVIPCSTPTDGGDGEQVAGLEPTDAARPDAGRMRCFDPIDLVFVLDVSTSMTMEASRLRAGVESIFAAADALTHDHRFGLVVFVDDALVVDSCAAFGTADALRAELQHWQDFCSSNQNPGGTGNSNADCAENSLDAIHAAATMCTWRAGATHLIIHVTDDTFAEPPYVFSDDPFFGGVPAVHRYSEVVDALVSSEIRVGAFAMRTPEDCGAGRSSDTARGFFTPYGGMDSLPDATHGRAWDLAEVRGGTLDMATAISELIEDAHCTVF